jgi:hypothetical protein
MAHLEREENEDSISQVALTTGFSGSARSPRSDRKTGVHATYAASHITTNPDSNAPTAA